MCDKITETAADSEIEKITFSQEHNEDTGDGERIIPVCVICQTLSYIQRSCCCV